MSQVIVIAVITIISFTYIRAIWSCLKLNASGRNSRHKKMNRLTKIATIVFDVTMCIVIAVIGFKVLDLLCDLILQIKADI